jgi:voltage-gated potassium channel
MSSQVGFKERVVNFVILNKYRSMLLGLVVIWFAAAFALYELESQAVGGSTYSSFAHSLWAIIVYLTSGLDEVPPTTFGGKIVSVMVLIMGMVVVGGITACLTSDLVNSVLLGAQVPEKPRQLALSEHIVIFGITRSTDCIVRELHHILLGTNRPIVLISRETERIPIGDPVTYKNVYCVYGEFTDDEVLARANIETAETVIILSDRGGDEEAVLTTLAVTTGAPRAHTIVELSEKHNERHLRRTHPNEIIHLDANQLLAQCAINHDLSSVFEELLSMQTEGNEIYLIPMPTGLIGKSFSEAAVELLEDRVLLIGIEDGSQGKRKARVGGPTRPCVPAFSINPQPSRTLQKGEYLVTVAFSKPNL